ncbi:MAG: hypothetical protein ACFCVE_03075 [Phycisphaerae bacterium]
MARNDPHTVESMKAKRQEERKDAPGKVGSDPDAAEHFAGKQDFGASNAGPNVERDRSSDRIKNRETQARDRHPGDGPSLRAEDLNFVVPKARPTENEGTASTAAGNEIEGTTIGHDRNEEIGDNRANQGTGSTTNVNNPARDDDAFAGDVSMDEAAGEK